MGEERKGDVPDAKVTTILLDHSSDDMTALEGEDEVLAAKMKLINDALEEIGFTWFHFKVFCIAGFGYAAESLIGYAQSTVNTFVAYQFNDTDYPIFLEMMYVGYLVGCVFWTICGDIIGRKLVFNLSLLVSALFGILVGAMNSTGSYCIMIFFSGFGVGGNLAIDSTVFLEFLPSKYSLLTTFFACWWAIGQVIAYLIAYAFFSNPKYYCSQSEGCTSKDNRGWRYVFYIDSCIVLFFALARLFVSLQETPKYLVTNNRDTEAVELLQDIAVKYNRRCSLTVEQLEDCGKVNKNEFSMQNPTLKDFVTSVVRNVRSLFSSRIMVRTMLLLSFSWLVVGIAYPLWAAFLPKYIGAATKNESTADTYVDSLISNAFSILGPLFATLLIMVPRVGRRGAMLVGGLSSMAAFMGYRAVDTRLQNIALSSLSYVAENVYYGCLFGFTPEVLPTYCRTTGSGIAMFFDRLGGVIAPIIEYYAEDSSSTAPIWVCAAFFGVIGVLALLFPYEPSRYRSV